MNDKVNLKNKRRINNLNSKRIHKILKNTRLKQKKIKYLIFLIICILAIIMVFNRDKLFLGNILNKIEDRIMSIGPGRGFPYKIDNDNIIGNNFSLINGNIAILTNFKFESISLSGKKISSRKHNFNKPVMKSSQNRSIIYDSGGHDYKIETCSRTLLEGISENPLINCAVSDSGVYGLITESKDYLSQIVIFNKDGTEKYKYYFAECYILDIDISNDGKCATVCGVSTVNGEIKSTVYIFKFDSKEPKNIYEYCDNMIVSVKYLSHKDIAVVGDKSINIINTWNNDNKELCYNNKILRCAEVNKKFGIVYCLSNSRYSSTCEMIGVDKKGNLKFDFDAEHCFNRIAYDFNNIFGIENDTVFVYDISGNKKQQFNIEIASNKIIPISQSCVYTISCDHVDRIYLK